LPIKSYGRAFGGLTTQPVLRTFEAVANRQVFNDSVDEVRMLMRIKRKLDFGEKDNFGILTPDAISGLKDSIFGTTFIVIILSSDDRTRCRSDRYHEHNARRRDGTNTRDRYKKKSWVQERRYFKQFLYESATLATIGGIIGLIVAKLIGFIVSAIALQTVIPWYAQLIAIGVCALVGIVAGLYPAWKRRGSIPSKH
jgi:putative ABC transport system permease protein